MSDRDDPNDDDDDDQSSVSPTTAVSHNAAAPPPPSPPPSPPPPPTSTTTTSVTKFAASLARKRNAWLLGLQKMITPRRRNSVEYSKVGEDDDDDDDDLQQQHRLNVEMTGIILTDVNLNDGDGDDNNNNNNNNNNSTTIPTEDNNEEEAMIGISVALDLPPPWELGQSPALNHTTHSNHSHSSSTGTINVADALQIVPTLLLASFALAATGAVLDSAQHWFVFEKSSTYFAVMPMLFGIKGNIEMLAYFGRYYFSF